MKLERIKVILIARSTFLKTLKQGVFDSYFMDIITQTDLDQYDNFNAPEYISQFKFYLILGMKANWLIRLIRRVLYWIKGYHPQVLKTTDEVIGSLSVKD